MHTDPRQNAYCISPGTFPPAMFRKNCRKIKDAGIETPIAIVNSCADPDIAENIVASGAIAADSRGDVYFTSL